LTVRKGGAFMNGTAIANQRFTMIANILSVIDDERARGKEITRAALEYGVSKPTIRRYLKLYQENGKEGLIPKNKATVVSECTTNGFEKDIRWGLNKFYYSTAKRSLKDAYRMTLEARFYKDGKLADAFPSFWQFRYYYRTHNKKQNEMISRNGLSYYQRNERPLLGDGVQQFANAVGTGMVDSTVCNIYLVNEAGQIVGRPLLTACIDSHSGMCLGYSLGWEGGIYSLNQLMMNIIKDKQEHCLSLGIEISKDDWNCKSLPGRFVTDMGKEYTGTTFSQVTELGITITNLPPYRPELKSKVEKFFDIVQGYYSPLLKGKGLVEPDYAERGVIDYRRQACLTLEDFEKIIVETIIFYNSKRLMKKFPFTEKMLNDGVKPYASAVWNWGIKQPSANLIEVSQKQLIFTLLPRTTGQFARNGLIVNKLRYSNRNFVEQFLAGNKVTVAYNPDDVSRVWLIEDGRYTPFELIESRYAELSVTEVTELKQKQKKLLRSEEDASLLSEVELVNRINTIATTASHTNRTDITNSRQAVLNIRNTRQKESRKRHTNLMQMEVCTNEE